MDSAHETGSPARGPASLTLAAFAAGLIAILGQSLIVRELVIAFLGNELVIGVTLGAWLFWTGLGSTTLGRLSEHSERPRTWLGAELVLLAVFLPLCFIGAGAARTLVGLESGETVGPMPIITACVTILLPLCLVNGALFPAICRALSDFLGGEAAIARAYTWEAVGSAAGGILFSAFVIRWAQPTVAVAACSMAALALGTTMVRALGPMRRIAGAMAFVLAVALCLEAVDRSPHVNTIYGRTRVRRLRDETAVYHNGILSATYPVRAEPERLVHLAMLQVVEPQRVLLVGGLSGTAKEALKYPGVRADVIELDPQSVAFVRRHRPPSPRLDRALESGRARLIFRDARRHIFDYWGAPYDAIILNVQQPVTAQANRYYTAEFFRAAKRVLADDGVLAFSVISAVNIATPEVRDFIACLKRTVEKVFTHVAVAPGTSNVFLAAPGRPADAEPTPPADEAPPDLLSSLGGAALRKGPITLDPAELLDRIRRRGVRTGSFEYLIQGDLNALRVRNLEDVLAESESDRINTDLHPISYSYGLVVWTAKARMPGARPWAEMTNAPFRWLQGFAGWTRGRQWAVGLLVLAGLVTLFLIWQPRRATAACVAVGCSGFTEIGVTIVALLGFQALYGYVYAMLGVVMASFMVGLCAGAACAGRVIGRAGRPFRWLLGTQSMLALYPLVLIGIILLASRTGAGGWPIVTAFLVLTFVAGAVGGMQLPLAGAVGRGRRGVAATISALDLLGAAVGAFTVSAYIIPTLGFVTLSLILSALGLIALAGLAVAGLRS